MSMQPNDPLDFANIDVIVPARFIQQMSLSTSLQQTLDAIAHWLPKIIDADRASVTLQDHWDGQPVTSLCIFSLEGSTAIPLHATIPLTNTYAGEVYQTRKFRLTSSLANTQALDGLALKKAGLNCCLSAPVMNAHGCYGTLNIGHYTENFYTLTHALILQCIADWLASYIRMHYEVANNERLANTDYLTGVLNRRSFMQKIQQKFLETKSHYQMFGIAMLDVDHFKQINDRYGHEIGDKVLQYLALHLTQYAQKGDIVARFGGEEFVIFFDAVNVKELEDLVTYCEQHLIEVCLPLGQNQLVFTASMGIAFSHEEDTHVESIIKRADLLLYKAKHNGRHQVQCEMAGCVATA